MPARWPIWRIPRARPGLQTTLIDIEDIGLRDDGQFVDLDDRAIELAFKLYPWEWMFHDAFGAQLAERADALDRAAMESDPVQQGHPAPAVGDVSEPSEFAAGLFRGRSERSDDSARPLSASRSIRAKAPMSRWSAPAPRWWSRKAPMARKDSSARRWRRCRISPVNMPVLGSWLVDHTPCGLSIREDENPITGNTSRFVPHAIL